jgi:hypothetical protein
MSSYLCNVDDTTRNQREPVYVRRQNCALRINTNTIQRSRFQLHSSPSLERGLCCFPDSLLQSKSSSAKLVVLDTNHIRWSLQEGWDIRFQLSDIRRIRSALLLLTAQLLVYTFPIPQSSFFLVSEYQHDEDWLEREIKCV